MITAFKNHSQGHWIIKSNSYNWIDNNLNLLTFKENLNKVIVKILTIEVEYHFPKHSVKWV